MLVLLLTNRLNGHLPGFRISKQNPPPREIVWFLTTRWLREPLTSRSRSSSSSPPVSGIFRSQIRLFPPPLHISRCCSPLPFQRPTTRDKTACLLKKEKEEEEEEEHVSRGSLTENDLIKSTIDSGPPNSDRTGTKMLSKTPNYGRVETMNHPHEGVSNVKSLPGWHNILFLVDQDCRSIIGRCWRTHVLIEPVS